ncbi:hypothetical protein SAMN05428947_108293 [Mucilaginibacter sp. OK283]|nr:hypothetical protein SAMN05428947_108293 [Mucilaginibacter sp. OK283]
MPKASIRGNKGLFKVIIKRYRYNYYKNKQPFKGFTIYWYIKKGQTYNKFAFFVFT